jgi:aerobic C4-dicarboxylate transport protein
VLILPVDWFVGIARALTNLIGNCVATIVVAAWENDIDKARAKRVLNGDADLQFVPDAAPAAEAASVGVHAPAG